LSENQLHHHPPFSDLEENLKIAMQNAEPPPKRWMTDLNPSE
jgi:hypothetical protein